MPAGGQRAGDRRQSGGHREAVRQTGRLAARGGRDGPCADRRAGIDIDGGHQRSRAVINQQRRRDPRPEAHRGCGREVRARSRDRHRNRSLVLMTRGRRQHTNRRAARSHLEILVGPHRHFLLPGNGGCETHRTRSRSGRRRNIERHRRLRVADRSHHARDTGAETRGHRAAQEVRERADHLNDGGGIPLHRAAGAHGKQHRRRCIDQERIGARRHFAERGESYCVEAGCGVGRNRHVHHRMGRIHHGHAVHRDTRAEVRGRDVLLEIGVGADNRNVEQRLRLHALTRSQQGHGGRSAGHGDGIGQREHLRAGRHKQRAKADRGGCARRDIRRERLHGRVKGDGAHRNAAGRSEIDRGGGRNPAGELPQHRDVQAVLLLNRSGAGRQNERRPGLHHEGRPERRNLAARCRRQAVRSGCRERRDRKRQRGGVTVRDHRVGHADTGPAETERRPRVPVRKLPGHGHGGRRVLHRGIGSNHRDIREAGRHREAATAVDVPHRVRRDRTAAERR